MDFILDPPRGVAPLQLGMTFDEAVAAVSPWGEPRVFGPYQHVSLVSISTAYQGVGFEVLLEKENCVTAIELWRPSSGGENVRLLLGDDDVFRTPANEILEHLASLGRTVDASNPERPVIPGVTLAFTRMTSQEVSRDSDGLPLHFTSVLVGDETYY